MTVNTRCLLLQGPIQMVTGYMIMNALRMPRNESTTVTAQTALMKANQALSLIAAGGGGGSSDNITIADSGSFTVDWATIFGGLMSIHQQNSVFEVQFDLMSGLSGSFAAGDKLLISLDDLSQNQGATLGTLVPIGVGLRGATGTYADIRVFFVNMANTEIADVATGLRAHGHLYDGAAVAVNNGSQTYSFMVLRQTA